MKNNSPNDALDQAIHLLETKRDLELVVLKQGLNDLVDSLKPINIIKDTFKKITTSSDLKEGIADSAIGLSSGILVKNLIFRNTHNPLTRALRGMVQTVVTGFVANNSEKIKAVSQDLFLGLLSKIRRKKRL